MPRPRLDTPNYRLARRGDVFYFRRWQDGAWQRISTGAQGRRQSRSLPTRSLPAISRTGSAWCGPLIHSRWPPKFARHFGDLQPDLLNRLTREEADLLLESALALHVRTFLALALILMTSSPSCACGLAIGSRAHHAFPMVCAVSSGVGRCESAVTAVPDIKSWSRWLPFVPRSGEAACVATPKTLGNVPLTTSALL